MNGTWVYIGERIGEIREYVGHYRFGESKPSNLVLLNVRIGPRPVYRYRWPEVANANQS